MLPDARLLAIAITPPVVEDAAAGRTRHPALGLRRARAGWRVRRLPGARPCTHARPRGVRPRACPARAAQRAADADLPLGEARGERAPRAVRLEHRSRE